VKKNWSASLSCNVLLRKKLDVDIKFMVKGFCLLLPEPELLEFLESNKVEAKFEFLRSDKSAKK